MEGFNGFYVFEPISSYLGISLDKVNFIMVQLFGVLFGHIFRQYLSCYKIGAKSRHLFEFLVGFSMLYFCFGKQAFILFLQSALTFFIICLLPHSCGLPCLVACMSILAVCHWNRLFFDPITYVTVEITGPLMINTQRMSSLAFGIADGCRIKMQSRRNEQKATEKETKTSKHTSGDTSNPTHSDTHANKDETNNININNDVNNNKYNGSNANNRESLNDKCKGGDQYLVNKSISEVPGILEVLSYTYCFHTVMCGPFTYYSDYANFIHETNQHTQWNKAEKGKFSYSKLNPGYMIGKNLLAASILILLSLSLDPLFNINVVAERNFARTMGTPWLCVYVLVVSHVAKWKYYIAWKLADAMNVAVGLSFNGWDHGGHERWDLVKSVDVLKVETASSFQMVYKHWNKSTSSWLRYTIYQRTNNTYLVFAVSAIWHGFFPGYYISFISSSFFMSVSRMARKVIRPYFVPHQQPSQSQQSISNQSQQSNPNQSNNSLLYDVITLSITKVQMAYLGTSFLLLDLQRSLRFFTDLYFCIHVINIVAFVILFFVLQRMHHKKP